MASRWTPLLYLAGGMSCWCVISASLQADPPETSAPAAQASQSLPLEKLTSSHLPNAIRLHPRVISGGLPDGRPGYRELAELGIQTIICVDGATPDIATAREFGLRYVHLPHGYDGISPQRSMELAKAVRDLPGPIYIHCHHGRHRSPVAAGVACVAAGLIPSELVPQLLDLAGTSRSYRGLYQTAERALPIADEQLDALEVNFPESAEIPPLAQAMVELERVHERLRTIAAAGWNCPPEHPDWQPAHEALLLQEHFAELMRLAEVELQPSAFRQLLADSQQAAESLHQQLARQATTAGQGSPHRRDDLARRISENCVQCHRTFRDEPTDHRP